MNVLKLKQDRYRRACGGYSRILKISCGACAHVLALYQKDGPGPLKRMYLDRIIAPESLARLERISLKRISVLTCPGCREIVGIPCLYQKEKRPCFRLFQGSVAKTIVKKNKNIRYV